MVIYRNLVLKNATECHEFSTEHDAVVWLVNSLSVSRVDVYRNLIESLRTGQLCYGYSVTATRYPTPKPTTVIKEPQAYNLKVDYRIVKRTEGWNNRLVLDVYDNRNNLRWKGISVDGFLEILSENLKCEIIEN